MQRTPLQIGQGKVLCFDNARWAERRGCGLAGEFQPPVDDWPRRSNGGCESRQCWVSPPLITPPPPPPPAPRTPSVSPPHTPLLWLSHSVYYGLKCDSQHRLSAGVPRWHTEGSRFFDARRASWLIFFRGGGDTRCLETMPFSAATVDLCALFCALVITSSAMEGKWEETGIVLVVCRDAGVLLGRVCPSGVMGSVGAREGGSCSSLWHRDAGMWHTPWFIPPVPGAAVPPLRCVALMLFHVKRDTLMLKRALKRAHYFIAVHLWA